MALDCDAGYAHVADLCDCSVSVADDMKMKYSPKLKMSYNPAMGQFVAWLRILDRCYDPDHPAYESYGGRGIEVYSGWTPWGNPGKNSFKQFRDDIHREIGRWPGQGYSLDRINNDGHYEPGNLRWATAKQQAQNRRPVYFTMKVC